MLLSSSSNATAQKIPFSYDYCGDILRIGIARNTRVRSLPFSVSNSHQVTNRNSQIDLLYVPRDARLITLHVHFIKMVPVFGFYDARRLHIRGSRGSTDCFQTSIFFLKRGGKVIFKKSSEAGTLLYWVDSNPVCHHCACFPYTSE